MSEIKSEKAKALIDKHWNCVIKGMNLSVGYRVSLAAVIIAETEAEERHAKQLQELKDKAVEAFIDNCPCRTPSGGCNFENGNSPVCFKLECNDVYTFTRKLNEK